MTLSKDLPFVFLRSRKTQEDHFEISEWCEDQFGPRWEAVNYRDGNWCVFWAGREFPKSYKWYFKNEKDAMLFVLRWS